MFFTGLDLNAVVLAALIPVLFGSFWYSPAVFGNHWLRLSGLQTTDIKRARIAIFAAFFGSFLASLVMSFILGALINSLVITSPFEGMTVGFYVWLGFVATTTLPEYLFGNGAKPILLYFLVNGYHLLSLVSMGALLFLWL